MARIIFESDEQFSNVVTLRESDKYSQLAYVKLTRRDPVHFELGCDEMLLTTTQLEQLGNWMILQAATIRLAQDARHSESSL